VRRTVLAIVVATAALAPRLAAAQPSSTCGFICAIEWKIEPTFTTEHLANRHRVRLPDGTIEQAEREQVFETVFAFDMSTRVPWLGFTAEAITLPFGDDNPVELEFEANFHWLDESKTGGWVSSHFDVIDKFSPAERPNAASAYTHKLNLELDTAWHLFKWLPEDRWLHGVELEASLDYVATGLPRKGDVFQDRSRYLDNASPWSLSIVVVLPVAPF
jgi:hypothetical protein